MISFAWPLQLRLWAAPFSCSKPEVPWRFLRVGEARTLAAMCEQLIPTDETPGAAGPGL